jgi:hypothetical protein
MALDLANGYIRKDAASASNIYYGYSYNTAAGDGDKVYAIRKVTTVGGVETVTWTNNSQMSYASSWTNRAASFVAPSGSLGLTWSLSTDNYNSAQVSWSLLSGVDVYYVTVKSEGGQLLNLDGSPLQGFYVNDKTYTIDLFNQTSVSVGFANPGTYSVTITGKNIAGSTSSIATLYFA